ncbi:MAG TPA: hypothetical protein GXZ45_08205 [Propionibacterium sp.]|nr:hypothetical protein [Propionibacterium sp.]
MATTPRPGPWRRLLAAKRSADALAARLEALDIPEVNPSCAERRRAHKAAHLPGGDERG